jgi:hypothetical protein
MTDSEIEEHIKLINAMSHEQLAKLWRYAPSGHPYFDDRLPLFNAFDKRFKEFGGMTPEISKEIDWL